jgi:hypothetical protein
MLFVPSTARSTFCGATDVTHRESISQSGECKVRCYLSLLKISGDDTGRVFSRVRHRPAVL